jgi:hypothetical protein
VSARDDGAKWRKDRPALSAWTVRDVSRRRSEWVSGEVTKRLTRTMVRVGTMARCGLRTEVVMEG